MRERNDIVPATDEGTRSCFSTMRSATPIWLSPKSISLMNPLLSMRMLSGFRSRWITCSSSWRYRSASTSSAMYTRVTSSFRLPTFLRSE